MPLIETAVADFRSSNQACALAIASTRFLLGGMPFPLFAAIYYWTPAVSKNPLSERLGKWVFRLMFAGTHIAFMPMHFSGLMGMPRRVYTYLPGRGLEIPNLISTLGAFLLAAGIVLFLIDLARNFRFTPGEGNAGNVFGGGTLEWLPTGLHSTRSIPLVRSRLPLWDDAELAGNVEKDGYLLPRSVTGLREIIVTSPVLAEPQQLLIIPGPSVWPVTGAIFTSGFFLLLTVQAYTLVLISGVLAVLAILRWMWETDRPIALTRADIGAGVEVPTRLEGRQNHGVQATIILVIVMAMIFVMAVFSMFFLWTNQPAFWIDPPRYTDSLGIFAAGLAGAACALVARRVMRVGGGPLAAVATVLAALLIAFATYNDYASWQTAGLMPTASGQGAIVYATIAYQASVVAVCLVMALYVSARAFAGLLTRPVSVTLDVVSIFIVYTAVQGLAGAAIPRLLDAVGP